MNTIEDWKRAIEGLTPGGSEFVDDPQRCAEYIRTVYSPMETFKGLRAGHDRLREVNALLTGALGVAIDTIIQLTNTTDSFCEFCQRHAPKDGSGYLTGRVRHTDACVIGNGVAALAAAAKEGK
jgi:hypothetical protein